MVLYLDSVQTNYKTFDFLFNGFQVPHFWVNEQKKIDLLGEFDVGLLNNFVGLHAI